MGSFDSGEFIRPISDINSKVVDGDRLMDYHPEEGLVTVKGKIGPLAEVGVGVHKIVSCKE